MNPNDIKKDQYLLLCHVSLWLVGYYSLNVHLPTLNSYVDGIWRWGLGTRGLIKENSESALALLPCADTAIR